MRNRSETAPARDRGVSPDTPRRAVQSSQPLRIGFHPCLSAALSWKQKRPVPSWRDEALASNRLTGWTLDRCDRPRHKAFHDHQSKRKTARIGNPNLPASDSKWVSPVVQPVVPTLRACPPRSATEEGLPHARRSRNGGNGNVPRLNGAETAHSAVPPRITSVSRSPPGLNHTLPPVARLGGPRHYSLPVHRRDPRLKVGDTFSCVSHVPWLDVIDAQTPDRD